MLENIKHVFMYDTKTNHVSHFTIDADADMNTNVLDDCSAQFGEVNDLEEVVNSVRDTAKDDALPSMIVLDKKDTIVYCPTKQAEEVMRGVFADYDISYLGNDIDFLSDMYGVDIELFD